MTRTEDDWQQQLDEVVALASILDTDFTLTAGPEVSGDIEQDISALALASPCSEQLECTAVVHVAFPSGVMTIRDTLQPSSSTAGETQSGWPVQHLPPILLQLSLPSTYPSEQPPNARINATWLTAHQIQQLQQHLLDMWNAASGLPICYTWVDWLQQDALVYLGISDTLDLSQFAAPGISNTHDQVATSSPGILNSSQLSPEAHSQHDGQHQHAGPCQPCQRQSAEKMLMDLLRFDAAEKLRGFHRGTWTCGICFEQFPGRFCVQASLQCGHVYCQSCMAQQCALHVKEGSLEFLRCPEPDCKEPLDRQMVKSVLSDEQNNRLESVELERTLNHMMDAVYCPRCSTISLEDEDNCAQCSNCFFAFCSLCNESWHPGTKCLSPEDKLELMRRRMAGTKSGDREFRKREAELQNLAHIEKNCKQCPACGMAIERSEGCNKMTCTSCGVFFCYRCNQQIDGYKHYWNGNCILFDLSEIERWEAEMGQQMMGVPEEQRRGADAAARPAVKSCRCPRCGRVAYKEGNNNNMRCPACTANFCYLCKELLAGRGASGRHFGPKTCKQHSAD